MKPKYDTFQMTKWRPVFAIINSQEVSAGRPKSDYRHSYRISELMQYFRFDKFKADDKMKGPPDRRAS